MKRVLICLLLQGIVFKAFPQLAYNDFRGKWQEISRESGNRKLSFKDTLLLDFNKRDSVVVRNGSGISYRGDVRFNKDTIYTAAVPFRVTSKSRNRLILQDSTGKRTLVKVKRFHHETLGMTPVATHDLSEPKNTTLNALRGEWLVYRTQAAPGTANDSLIIRKITISKNGQAKVEYQLKDRTNIVTSVIKKTGSQYSIGEGPIAWNFHIYRSSRNELIFGNHGGIVYFAKKEH